MAMLSRRTALQAAGLAAVAGSVGAARIAPAGDDDARLRQLFGVWRDAECAIERACDAADRVPALQADAAKRAVFAAFDVRDAIVGQMADTPAQGPLGLWVKAQVATDACTIALAEEDERLVESLHADATRLMHKVQSARRVLDPSQLCPTVVRHMSVYDPPIIPASALCEAATISHRPSDPSRGHRGLGPARRNAGRGVASMATGPGSGRRREGQGS